MLLGALLGSLRRREPFAMTWGEQRRDFLHVEDAAEAAARVLEQREEGTWNLASGESLTVRQAAELGAAIAGRPDLLRLGALPYRAREVFDARLDSSAVRAALGWRPRVTLRAGLEALWSGALR
jgi:nucleoside-diphosphate-sugar epimerase